MLVIQTKLIDFKTKNCIGVVCINDDTSVALSLDKAKELGVEDIDIVDYLGVGTEEVVVNTKRPNYYAYKDKARSILDDYFDVPYEWTGAVDCMFLRTEIIWGYAFAYLDFIELDNEVSIKRAISNSERSG